MYSSGLCLYIEKYWNVFFGVFVVLKKNIGSVPLWLAHMVQDKYVNPLFNLPLVSF